MSSSCRRWPGVSLGHGIHVSPDLDRRCKGGISWWEAEVESMSGGAKGLSL